MRRLPTVGDDENLQNEGAGWIAGVVPDAVALRGLSVAVHGPDAVTLGEPAEFHVVVRNRLPVAVSVTLPTSRLWGWQVDGVPEADERGYDAPDTSRGVTFAGGERKAFSVEWDGRVRRAGTAEGGGSEGATADSGGKDGGRKDGDGEDGEGATGNVWVDHEGRCEFTGYLAADRWEERGLYDRTDVVVRR